MVCWPEKLSLRKSGQRMPHGGQAAWTQRYRAVTDKTHIAAADLHEGSKHTVDSSDAGRGHVEDGEVALEPVGDVILAAPGHIHGRHKAAAMHTICIRPIMKHVGFLGQVFMQKRSCPN